MLFRRCQLPEPTEHLDVALVVLCKSNDDVMIIEISLPNSDNDHQAIFSPNRLEHPLVRKVPHNRHHRQPVHNRPCCPSYPLKWM